MKKKLMWIIVLYDVVSRVLVIERWYSDGTESRRNYKPEDMRLWQLCKVLGSVQPTPDGWYWDNVVR